MSELVEWVHRLKDIENSKTPRASGNFRRILVPGWEPVQFEGFLRAERQQAFAPFGGTPTSFSVLQWLDAARSAPQTLSELPSQIGGLLSLATDRRIVVLDELDTQHEGTNTHTFLPLHQHADARLVSPLDLKDTTINQRFTEQLSKLCSLPSKKQKVISEATSLHYGAILLYDVDLAAAYTLLVAGIEALSREFGAPPAGWSKWDKAEEWNFFMKKIHLNGEQQQQLRDRLMKDKQMRLKETFVNYVIDELPDSMWEDSWKEWMYTVAIGESKSDFVPGQGNWIKDDKVKDHLTTNREELRAALKKTYSARSGFVHEGKRVVNFLSQIQGAIAPDYTKPLPFSILRTILSTLITYELERHSSDFILPRLELRAE